MKITTTLFACLLSIAAMAQTPAAPAYHTTSVADCLSPGAQYKTEALAERLIAMCTYGNNYFQNAMLPHDSSRLSYTGSRGQYALFIGGNVWAFDSLIAYHYDSATGYHFSGRSDQTFDAHTNLLMQTNASWNTSSNSLVNTDRNTNTYDANNNMITYLMERWYTAGSSWQNNNRSAISYDANNNRTLIVNESWNTGTSAWTNSGKYTFTFNAHNKITESLYQYGTPWTNGIDKLYTFDANDNQIHGTAKRFNTTTLSWEFGLNNEGYNQFDDTYTAFNKVATDTIRDWLTGTTIGYKTLNLYSYNATQDVSSKTKQSWLHGAWRNDTKFLYIYDANHNQLSSIQQTWDTTAQQWNNYLRETNVYDSYNMVTLHTYEVWRQGSWQPYSFTRYYYDTYTTTGIATLATDGSELNVYPSPASDHISIALTQPAARAATLSIYDATGRLQRQWQSPAGKTYEATLSIGDMPSGHYYLQVLDADGHHLSRPFAVVK